MSDIVPIPVSAIEPETSSDHAAAVAITEGHFDTLRYVTDSKQWRRWTPESGRWTEAPEAEVATLVAALGKTSDRQVQSGLRYLRYVPQLQARAEDFDRHPYLFNTTSGTLNLRPADEVIEVSPGEVYTFPAGWDWEFRLHDPEDLLTQVAGCGYDPDARAPRWDAFLERVLPDADIRDWLQRLVGYALVGRQTEAVFPILWGKGANGKSTFVDILGELFGEYGVVAEKSLFKAVKNDGHPTDRAALVGKRLARSEELPNVEMDEPKIKGLTGGDKISGRLMRENFKEWAPTHTFLVHSNNEPRFTGTDDGIWRRVVLIPFAVKIPKEEDDKYLKDKLYKELPGILNWALAGYEAYCERHLALPEVLQQIRDEYRVESDTVTPFVDRYEASVGSVTFGLIQDHKDYAVEYGLSPEDARKNFTAAVDRLKEMGAKSKKAWNPALGKTAPAWVGIRIKDTA